MLLRATASRVQSRVDAIRERDGTEKAAIEGRGVGISYLFAKDIARALTKGAEEIERLQAALDARDGYRCPRGVIGCRCGAEYCKRGR